MLFRNLNGELVLIEKNNYTSNISYYSFINKCFNISFAKDQENESFKKILNLIKSKER